MLSEQNLFGVKYAKYSINGATILTAQTDTGIIHPIQYVDYLGVGYYSLINRRIFELTMAISLVNFIHSLFCTCHFMILIIT